MDLSPDILIIGAGPIGLSTADALNAAGCDVSVLDCKPGPGQGASYYNSGMLHPSQAWPWGRPEADQDIVGMWAKRARQSVEIIQSNMDRFGLSDKDRAPGCVQRFDSESERDRLEPRYHSIGVTYERHTPNSLYFPDDFSGNAHGYFCALEGRLKERGVTFIYDVGPVALSENSAVWSGGRCAFQQLVLSAGVGTVGLARQLEIDVPVTAVRGWAVNYDRRPEQGAVLEAPVMHHESRSALTLFADHVRLSGTVNQDDPAFLIRTWQRLAPELMQAFGEPALIWSGDRPVSKSGFPIIGRSARPNVWINTGHGHMGWTLSAISGRILSDMMMGTAPVQDI